MIGTSTQRICTDLARAVLDPACAREDALRLCAALGWWARTDRRALLLVNVAADGLLAAVGPTLRHSRTRRHRARNPPAFVMPVVGSLWWTPVSGAARGALHAVLPCADDDRAGTTTWWQRGRDGCRWTRRRVVAPTVAADRLTALVAGLVGAWPDRPTWCADLVDPQAAPFDDVDARCWDWVQYTLAAAWLLRTPEGERVIDPAMADGLERLLVVERAQRMLRGPNDPVPAGFHERAPNGLSVNLVGPMVVPARQDLERVVLEQVAGVRPKEIRQRARFM